MSEQETSGRTDLQSVLRKQRRRVVTALAAEEARDASPILEDDEVLPCEEYVTLVYELHHVQLPELQASGVIEFDRREDTVRRGPRFDAARSLLDPGDGQ